MNGFIEKCLISALLCCLCVRANAQENIVKDIEEMGTFDHWTVRVIEESSIIGGATTYLYEPTAVNDTIYGRQAYVNPEGCVWRTSNAYADVLGVVKTSTSVFPEKRGDGYCARMEVRMAHLKVLGLINMDVACQGSMFLGRLQEPIKDTKNPQGKLLFGFPFTDMPKGLQLDYKAIVGGDAVRATGLSRVKPLGYKDYADLVLMLQYRWEDEKGNVYAYRVGTAYERITKTVTEWQNAHFLPVKYGDITSDPDFRPYMGLIKEELSNYTLNSKGESVPVHEIGWAKPGMKPNWLIIRFSSSYGVAFEGAIGNTLWIDNVKLVY
mgnify:CR=1 FL=1